MSSVVVDTDVVSFLFKNHPTAALYDPEITGKIPIVSFMTMPSSIAGLFNRNGDRDGAKWLSRYLAQFAVLPYSRMLCSKWAEVTVSAQRNGRRSDCADAWIAASALLYGVPLVTHNPGDYRGVPGLTVISHGE
jgi:tRNA(fMet)-specific endonuclease VapC